MLKERNRTPGLKNISHSAGEVAPWPMPGTGKHHNCRRWQPAEDTETLLLPRAAAFRSQWPSLLTLHEGTWDRGEAMVDTSGSETWRCWHLSVVTHSFSSTAGADVQELVSSVRCTSHPSPSPPLYLTSLRQKKRVSQPWFLCALLGSLGQALTKPKWLQNIWELLPQCLHS